MAGHHRGYYKTPADPLSRLPRGISRKRANAPIFCKPTSDENHLAVIGIFSPDEHIGLRMQIRGSWLNASAPRILTKFVMRGVGTLTNSIDESATHGDVVFVNAPAGMPRKSGPLLKLMKWLECAASAWPAVELIGKADDDTYVHLPGVLQHLDQTLAFAAGAPIYWCAAADIQLADISPDDA